MTLRLELLILVCFCVLFGQRTVEGQFPGLCNTLTQTTQQAFVECTTALGCRPPRIPECGSLLTFNEHCSTARCNLFSTDGELTATFLDNFDDCIVDVLFCVDIPINPPANMPPATPPVVVNGQCDPVTQTELFLISACDDTGFCFPKKIPDGSTFARFEEIECFGIGGCTMTAPDGVLTATNFGGPESSCTARIFSCVDNPTTIGPTTMVPTTICPTTMVPTTMAPTTMIPTTMLPTTMFPTTMLPTTMVPTTMLPTTMFPTTMAPTTMVPTTMLPTTMVPTTMLPTTMVPTTMLPTTMVPTTMGPTSMVPTTMGPTTMVPTTRGPTTMVPTTIGPTTIVPTTMAPTTMVPTTKAATTVTVGSPECSESGSDDVDVGTGSDTSGSSNSSPGSDSR